MPSYTVREVIRSKPWSKDGGDPTVIYYDFLVEGEDRQINTGRKPGNPLTVGTVLEGTLEDDQRGNGLKFVRAQSNGYGGGGGRGRSPEDEARTRKSIEMQHAQKAGVDLVRLAVEGGTWKPESADELTAAVMKVARKFFDQIEEVAK